MAMRTGTGACPYKEKYNSVSRVGGNPVKHAGDSRLLTKTISRRDSAPVPVLNKERLAPTCFFWIPDTMKNMVAGAPYFSIVRE